MTPFKTPYNAYEHPCRGERIIGPTLTVPDQTMTISEIMRRFASGLPVGGAKVPIWDGETDDDLDLSQYDRADRAMIAKEKAEELNALRERIETSEKERQARKQKWRDEQLIKATKAQMSSVSGPSAKD